MSKFENKEIVCYDGKFYIVGLVRYNRHNYSVMFNLDDYAPDFLVGGLTDVIDYEVFKEILALPRIFYHIRYDGEDTLPGCEFLCAGMVVSLNSKIVEK